MDGDSEKTLSESEVSEDSLDLETIIQHENKDLTPTDIDVQIQTERITAIFKETLHKTEISLFLSILQDDDYNLLASILDQNDFKIIRRILAKNSTLQSIYRDVNSKSKYQTILENQVEEVISYPESKEFTELTELICILQKYKEINLIISDKIKYWTGFPSSVLFLESLKKLKCEVIDNMTVLAADKLKKDLIHRNLNRINKMQKAKIADFTSKIEKEEHNFQKIYKRKDAIIKKHEEELTFLKSDCKDVIKKKILESEKKMLLETHLHETRLEELSQKDTDKTEEFEQLIKDHLLREKALRTKRLKVETQLVSWLRKYDSEIGDKQTEFDELSTNYEIEKKGFNDFQEKFDIQQLQYVPLMAAKESEYQAELQIKLERFILSRAARVVQHAWREILANRLEKKKAKKAAKKKK